MGLFRKRDRVIDLAERYRDHNRKEEGIKAEPKETKAPSSGGMFSIFGSGNPSTTVASSGSMDIGSDSEEKKRKLVKRLVDMTTKMEDLSNQIYHLQQRLDLIEKKLNVNKFN